MQIRCIYNFRKLARVTWAHSSRICLSLTLQQNLPELVNRTGPIRHQCMKAATDIDLTLVLKK
jgi:hypothetical protein